jgi:hypothetical protein
VSFDGIDWIYIKKILDESYLVPEWCHPNHFDSHNCIVYNDKEDYYYIYLRNNKLNQRFVQYTKTKDFNHFDKCNNINIFDNNHIVLYTPGIFKYENSDYFLGIPTVNGTNYDTKNNSTLMVSHDGINFNILTKELFNENNETIMNISSIVPSSDNNKMYIYSHCNLTEDEYLSCHSFEKNRIQKIVCNENGFIKTELINLHDLLTVNYETFEKGYLNILFINKMNEIIFNSENISGNYYDYKIEWNKNIDNEEYYIQFNMYNCNLYSFSYNSI